MREKVRGLLYFFLFILKCHLILDELVKSKSPTRESKPSLPPEAKSVGREFGEYLSPRVKKAGIADLSRNIQSFIEKVHKRVEILPIEEVAVMVQNFYQALAKRLETHENFQGLTEEERSKICDLTERYLMICCYKQLFCPLTTQDEDKDLEIQERIRSVILPIENYHHHRHYRKLSWVTANHLDCPFSETSEGIRDLIYQAINDILQVDGSKAPQDKLESVVSCAKKIFSVIQAGDKSVASADDFLPSLIFILLKANPPRILSNINFITRFTNEARLRSGEEGYYFTNLCCGLNFIENLSAASLNLPQSEFDSFMSGEIPPGSWGATLIMCEGLQSVNTSIATLRELNELQARIVSDCERLEREMAEFQNNISSEVERVMARTEYTIRPAKKPVTVDALSPQAEETLLPPPLLPQPLSGLPDTMEDTSSPESGPLSLSTYVGFSAQSASIPSISCNTADSAHFSASPVSLPPPYSPSPQSMVQSLSSFTPSTSTSSILSVLSPSSSPSHSVARDNLDQ